jgi:two-component system, NtrC family, sensor kinase
VADQLTQVIMNLLINAMDALEPVMDRPPNIAISTRVDGDRVRMTVEDNGPGMDKEVLERAFEAFFTTKPAGKGTGLGLSLCYSIMKNHGGSIEIESTPGRGTRVQVTFPINEIT